MGEKGKAREERVEVQRKFDMDDLPRDEDGKVILPDDITYAEFIRLTHPEMTDAQVARAVRREQRNTRLVRAELLVIAAFVIVIIILAIAS